MSVPRCSGDAGDGDAAAEAAAAVMEQMLSKGHVLKEAAAAAAAARPTTDAAARKLEWERALGARRARMKRTHEAQAEARREKQAECVSPRSSPWRWRVGWTTLLAG